MGKVDKAAQEIANVMVANNKELDRGIDYVEFLEQKNEIIDLDRSLIQNELLSLYNYFPTLEQKVRPALFLENALLEIFPNSRSVEVKTSENDICKYELDCVQQIEDRFILISACVDIDKVNVLEHVFEARIHALQYGGFAGQAICVLPNYAFDDDEFDTPETRTICGVRIFDRTDFHDETGETSADHFVTSLRNYVENIEEHASNNFDALERTRQNLQPKTDVTLEPILQTSIKSFQSVLDILKENNDFIFEDKLLKLDECLFQFLGVKNQEHNHEWVLIARIDVPPYEQSIVVKYRRLIYQYVATALKFAGENFRLLIFTNCDDSLEAECKVLGNDMRLRVLSINASQWKKYTNVDSRKKGEFGAKKLLQTWSSGELEKDKNLIEELRQLNLKADGNVKIAVESRNGVLALDRGSPCPSIRKAIYEITSSKPKNGTKFTAEFSRRTGQFVRIKKDSANNKNDVK